MKPQFDWLQYSTIVFNHLFYKKMVGNWIKIILDCWVQQWLSEERAHITSFKDRRNHHFFMETDTTTLDNLQSKHFYLEYWILNIKFLHSIHYSGQSQIHCHNREDIYSKPNSINILLQLMEKSYWRYAIVFVGDYFTYLVIKFICCTDVYAIPTYICHQQCIICPVVYSCKNGMLKIIVY